MTDLSRIFLFAGEPSGDHYGGALMRALQNGTPNFQISGVGGPEMRKAGIDLVSPMEEFQLHGLGQIVRGLPRAIQQFYSLRDHILSKTPDGVVFIDYPGFNLRMAKALRKKGYTGKLIHYISPSVWAWGKGRVNTMADTLDLLMTIFPFEPAYYAHTPLRVEFVGHPLLSSIDSYDHPDGWREKYGISKDAELLALFPGSRPIEVKRNLPKMLIAAKNWLKNKKARTVAVSCAQERSRPLLERLLDESGCKAPIIPSEERYSLMKEAKVATAAAGTVNLELALQELPTAVVYDLSYTNRFYAHYILRARLEHYSITNIIAGKEVYPELIKEPFAPDELMSLLESLSTNTGQELCKKECQRIKALLGKGGANERAANAIRGIFS